MTALLRRGWGLEGILRESENEGAPRKQRDDHRHHAIDAFVVANTTQRMLQEFAHAARSNHDTENKLAAVAGNVLPWKGFERDQLKPFLDRIVVSHKPDRGTRGVQGKGKTTGQLHNDMAYGFIEPLEDRASKVVIRKELIKFKKRADLESVRDTALRTALVELWDRVGHKPADFALLAATEGVLLNGRRQLVRRVRITDEQRIIPIWKNKDHSGRPYKGYLPGGNEFADIWQMRDGSWKMVVVPTFDANQRDFDIERFRPMDRSGRRDPTAKRLVRLQINDMAALGEEPNRHIVRVRKISNSKSGVLVWLDDHNEANVDARVRKKEMKESKYSARQLRKHGFRTVQVNEIGQVRDTGPPRP